MQSITMTAPQVTAIASHVTATDNVTVETTNMDNVVAVVRNDEPAFLVDANGTVTELDWS